MAVVTNTKIMRFYAFILVSLILFSHGILCVEAIRQLKSKHCKHSCSKKLEVVSVEKPSSFVSSAQAVVPPGTFDEIETIQKRSAWSLGKDDKHKSRNGPMQAKVVEKIDDFEPTGPGHSPGIGHSIHN
ncbi:hypothetical protein HAX54_011883 [Datura stramonium]|uniref:Uncharacterized protein n=1 Tax=Datura stramonium TaxID=4076 RepID=A0ABS8TKP4_DATST|nr:hypothetical protein [Datura stramonium]